jgi:hypothetical protein
MKISTVSKIILKTQKPAQLIAALLGCLIGFLLIITSVQNYFNLNSVLSDKDQAIGSQYLVINKKVSLLNSLNLKKSAFTKAQLEEIETLPSVEKISTFTPNQFEARAYLQLSLDQQNQIELKTDLFLESIENSFIDVKSEDWKWNIDDEVVPVILPADFINLYNFTYAPARNLPQISKSTIQMFGFKIIIGNENNETTFKGKIIGFSNRITSMIVPLSFMNYANEKYKNETLSNQDYYRLIVKINPSKLSDFNKFLNEKGFETNNELLKSAKLSSVLQITLTFVFLIGMLMILNAFSGFLLYLQLTITKSKYELETLLRLGYPHRKLVNWYATGVLILLLSIFTISFSFLKYIQIKVVDFMTEYGFEVSTDINNSVIYIGVFVVLILFVLFYLSLIRQIYKLSLPK